jgi:hypothetical protein
MSLVDVAEVIDSIDRVRELVDLALLRQQSVLWTSIATTPAAWTELGRRVHSPTIFTEGCIHLVGLWPSLEQKVKDEMNSDVRALVQKKFDELEKSKEVIELRILGHYPTFMQRAAEDKPGRPSYANDIYMWMAVSFYRQWFAQNIAENNTRNAADGGFAFYTALAKGGQAYLTHWDFGEFHKYFPMSSKGCNVLEANMGVLKEDVKNFVQSITQARVKVKEEDLPAGATLNWLTCAVFEPEDMLWSVPEVVGNGDQEMGQATVGEDASVDGDDEDEDF